MVLLWFLGCPKQGSRGRSGGRRFEKGRTRRAGRCLLNKPCRSNPLAEQTPATPLNNRTAYYRRCTAGLNGAPRAKLTAICYNRDFNWWIPKTKNELFADKHRLQVRGGGKKNVSCNAWLQGNNTRDFVGS